MEEAPAILVAGVRAIREGADRDRERAPNEKTEIFNKIQTLTRLAETLPATQQKIDAMEEENCKLASEVERLRQQANLQDQHQKSKNLILFGVPGSPREERNVTEQIVSDICSQTGMRRRIAVAHRLSQKENAPVLLQFECKPDAQEAFTQFRRSLI